MKEELAWWKAQIHGRSSEKSSADVSPDQGMLFNEAEVLTAIAEAIASLEAQQSAAAEAGLSSPPQPSTKKGASAIRGATPQVESPFMPSQSEYFRAGELTAPKPNPKQKYFMPPEDSVSQGVGLRGGGSLSLDGPAGLGRPDPCCGGFETGRGCAGERQRPLKRERGTGRCRLG